jgi:hypothetical protein
MKSLLVAALLTTLGVIVSTATAEERACRPSLSNFYHCPDTSNPTTSNTKSTGPAASAKPRRTCTPSLSNGYSCLPTSKSANRTSSSGTASERSKGRDQYTTEARARLRCPVDTVVWANTRSNIYHFQGTRDYGNTKRGGYMCEQDAISGGMRAAKNETHP